MIKIPGKAANTIKLFGIVLFALCLLSLRFGSASLTASEFFEALSDVSAKTPYGTIIYHVRLPRILAAIVAGAGLGVSGAILQLVLGNSMASPNLVGVNSGAGFAVILTQSLFPHLFGFIPFFALAGAFATTLFITALSRKAGFSKSTVILVGLAVSAILSAGISLICLLDTEVLVSYNAFSTGSLSGVKLRELSLPSVMVLSVLTAALCLSRKMDILSLGDTSAHSLGLSVTKTRYTLVLLASASSAAAVSFAGLLGFVGLMSPHIARSLGCTASKHIVAASCLIGACLVVLSDFLGRVLFAPTELPVGIIMALAGSPFFLFLLFSKGGKNRA